MAERLKLTVIQVKDVQRVGEKQKEKLTFLAHGEDGKELSFSTMRTSLFDAIRNNKEIEADVEVTEKDTYINRYVSQVYVDGKAIATEGKWQGGGRQWGGKSPEEIASIENQVRAKLVMEGWIAGKLLDDSIEVLGMRGWIRKGLPFDATVVVQPLSKATETTVDTPRRSIYDEIEAIGAEPISEEKAGELRLGLFKVECKRYGWDVSTKKGADAVKSWLVEHFLMGWKELTAEAQEQAIARMHQMWEEKEEK